MLLESLLQESLLSFIFSSFALVSMMKGECRVENDGSLALVVEVILRDIDKVALDLHEGRKNESVLSSINISFPKFDSSSL